jgi:hypothetical protein
MRSPVLSLFRLPNNSIANFIIVPAVCLALVSCSQNANRPGKNDVAERTGIPDPAAVYNRLSAYADDLSAVSKRKDIKGLPTSWNGMMELANVEMQGRQWESAKAHLSLATKMAPNTASLVLTRGQFAMLEAKRGRYDAAITYLDALIESPEVAANSDMTSAVQTMRATITQYHLSGRRMP